MNKVQGTLLIYLWPGAISQGLLTLYFYKCWWKDVLTVDVTTREKYAIFHYITHWAHAHRSILRIVYFQDILLNKPYIYVGICLNIYRNSRRIFKKLIIKFTWEEMEWEGVFHHILSQVLKLWLYNLHKN